MDMVTKLLIGGIVATGLLLIVLLISIVVTRQKEKKHSVKESDDFETDDKKVASPTIRTVEPVLDTSGVQLVDPAVQPLLDNAEFFSDETEGEKLEQFNTVAASEVARDIVDTHGASGFHIIYKGVFTADILMYKFYYIRVADKDAENGSVFYVIYESGVSSYGIYIGEDEELINETYLVNKKETA